MLSLSRATIRVPSPCSSVDNSVPVNCAFRSCRSEFCRLYSLAFLCYLRSNPLQQRIVCSLRFWSCCRVNIDVLCHINSSCAPDAMGGRECDCKCCQQVRRSLGLHSSWQSGFYILLSNVYFQQSMWLTIPEAKIQLVHNHVPPQRPQCLGLFFYNELLHVFYCLRICDYKNAAQHIDRLDASMKNELQQMQELKGELETVNQSLSRSDLHPRDRLALSEKQSQLQEQLRTMAGKGLPAPAYSDSVKQAWGERLELAPFPMNGEWLPRNAVYALVDLMVATLGRPKGLFKECSKRIESGMLIVQGKFLLERQLLPILIFALKMMGP